tara:strand:+ start:16693 stop:18531 length:1839 start_codon:yes stop_codon:yes gene_type:complete
MCGIFGIITNNDSKIKSIIKKNQFNDFIKFSERRGRDSSGFVNISSNQFEVKKRDKALSKIISYNKIKNSKVCFGHSRLVTNGFKDNQPVISENNILIHNGIIVNSDEIFQELGIKRKLEIDSEIILSLYNFYKKQNKTNHECIDLILSKCKGTISAVLYNSLDQELILFSNNGSLYTGSLGHSILFSSESYPLKQINCTDISQTYETIILKIPNLNSSLELSIDEKNEDRLDLIPKLGIIDGREKILEYKPHNLKRCKKCILPETMPFIEFDSSGICNYCNEYKIVNQPKPLSDFNKLLEPYRRDKGPDCIIPLSGGRDSCMGLHLAVTKLGLRPITYTYDWGMVTDLARRNISRICSRLGVENIIVADDIKWKRENVSKNVKAWLKNPDLGMVNLFTAGDKHFFKHVEEVKKQTGISLNLWSVNPLEVTHFKSGFLGIKPNLKENEVYSSGLKKQLYYQKLRFKKMLESPGYFNRSIIDNLIGEFYRSFNGKTDYYHVFDYYKWDENEIDDVLINKYEFEKAPDTSTTWRIGDGTAAFYNYIYYTLAGFSEHDTFRSNQIREGQITREEALKLVYNENKPRYENIVWYLEAIGLDYSSVIKRINSIKKIF